MQYFAADQQVSSDEGFRSQILLNFLIKTKMLVVLQLSRVEVSYMARKSGGSVKKSRYTC